MSSENERKEGEPTNPAEPAQESCALPDTEGICPVCGAAYQWEHAHQICPRCKIPQSCCN